MPPWRCTTADEKCGIRPVARVIRPGHPAKRDKEVSDTTRSRYARCPGLMTRATRGSSCTYFHRRHEDTKKTRRRGFAAKVNSSFTVSDRKLEPGDRVPGPR